MGLCLMFVAAGIHSLFHDELHIVSPRSGFALSEPFKIAASIGLICPGLGVSIGALLDRDTINDWIKLARVTAFAVGIAGALTLLLSFLSHYLIVLLG